MIVHVPHRPGVVIYCHDDVCRKWDLPRTSRQIHPRGLSLDWSWGGRDHSHTHISRQTHCVGTVLGRNWCDKEFDHWLMCTKIRNYYHKTRVTPKLCFSFRKRFLMPATCLKVVNICISIELYILMINVWIHGLNNVSSRRRWIY